jgi:hypothetical protein
MSNKEVSISVNCHVRDGHFTAHAHSTGIICMVIQAAHSYPYVNVFLPNLAALREAIEDLTTCADLIANDQVLASLTPLPAEVA